MEDYAGKNSRITVMSKSGKLTWQSCHTSIISLWNFKKKKWFGGRLWVIWTKSHLLSEDAHLTISWGPQHHFGACVCVCMLSHFSHVWLFATPWTVALQSPLSMGFSSQEYWSGLPCPSPGIFPTQRLNLCLLRLPVSVSRFFTTSATWEAL